MPPLISVRNLSKSYGPRPLFEGLTFGLSDNERTGLIGPNGAGKSTLLKILAGLETPDEGDISTRRGLKVRYLPQQDTFEAAAAGISVRDELVRALQDTGLEDYAIDMRVDEHLERAGFNPDQQVAALSGGWRKRLAILSQVIREPDILLLDEPTNHLDLEGVRWLERFLSGLSFSFLMITHDRRFLEAVCTRVIELNKRYKDGHFSSVGNYSDFIENREAHFSAQTAREDAVRNTVRREVEWLRRGAKARTTKQKARIDRAGDLINELSELKFRNTQDRSASLDFHSSERQTKRLIEAQHIVKSRGGRRLFGPLDLSLGPGDKLGLLGGNGSGKSTLLKILAGELAPDAGTIKRAYGLKIVTFDQHREQLDLSLTLRRALCDSGDYVKFKDSPIHVAAWAERFLFSKEQLNTPLSQLSGGEQSRVLIARLMLKPADVLLLDEPTNDLDINSLEVLESSMIEFSGALVLVTHDRYLLDRVSDQILALDGRGNARYFADLAQWEDLTADEAPISPVTEAAPRLASQPVVASQKKGGLTPKEEKELKRVEAEIRAAETERSRAELALADPSIATNATELTARHEALKQTQQTIDALFRRWEALESRRR
jgi:ABC transport system ATP-binding/permease protein